MNDPDGYDIQNIIPMSGFEGYLEESIQIVELDGSVSDTIYWCCEDIYGEAGWYLGEEKSTRKIKPGEALLVYCPTGNFSLQYAGQVMMEATSFKTTGAGLTTVGNSCPIAKNIQCFVPISGFEGYLEESIQIVELDGSISDTIYWCCEDIYGVSGWYLGEDYCTREILPGQGFLIDNPTGAEGFEIGIPGVNTEAPVVE